MKQQGHVTAETIFADKRNDGKSKADFIANDVKKGDQVFKLRDDSGYPQWSPPRKNQEK